MKKLLNFLILALLLAAAPQAEATNFVARIDHTSGLTAQQRALASSISNTLIPNGNKISLSEGFNNLSVSQNIFAVKGANRMYVNGEQITSTKSNNLYFTASSYGDGALLEIYQSASTPTYEYPLTLNIDDEFGHIKKIVASDDREWTPFSTSSSDQFPETVDYTFGTQFTVYTDKEANDDMSITKYKTGGAIQKFTDKDGYAYAYTFIPMPTLNGCTFTMTIDESLRVIPFTTTIRVHKYIIGYQINHNATGEESSVEDLMPLFNQAVTDAGEDATSVSFNSTFHDGDTYTLYSTEIASSVSMESTPVSYTRTTYNNQECYAYTFTPADDCTLNATFVDQFAITINIDLSNVAKANIYNSSGQIIDTKILNAGDNPNIKCPVDGRIIVSLIDDTQYLFTKCDTYAKIWNSPTTELGKPTVKESKDISLLAFDPPTNYFITIINQTSNYDDSTYWLAEECGPFRIETMSTSQLNWYSCNIVVDDPTKVSVKIGPSNDPNAAVNRSLTGFRPGEVMQVPYSELDKYIVVSPSGLNQIYSVEADKGEVDASGSESNVYKYLLNNDLTDGATIDIMANRPLNPGNLSFTFNIDHPEYMVSLNRQVDWVNYPVGGIHKGANTVTFDDGEQFLLQTDADYIPTVMQDGQQIEDLWGRFTLTPSNNSVVNVVYGDIVLPTFTVVTDMPDRIQKVQREDRGKSYDITEQFTTLPFVAGDDVLVTVYTAPTSAYWVSKTGQRTNLQLNVLSYSFSPSDECVLYLIYENEPSPKFTFNVDDTSKIKKIWDSELGNEYTDLLVNGENKIPVGTGKLYVTVEEEATRFTVDGVDVEYASGRKRYAIEVNANSYVNVIFAKDPKLTFCTDMPSEVTSFNNTTTGEDLLSTITFGTVTSDFVRGQSFSFTLAKQPLAVTVNGEALAPTSGYTYNITPGDADEVRVFFNYVPAPGKLYTVKAEMVNLGSDKVLNFAYVGDKEITGKNILDGILVNEGDDVSINCNKNAYIINSVTVNGTALEAPFGVYNFNVYENSTITIDARIIKEYTFTIHTNAKDNLLIYSGIEPTNETIFTLDYPRDENDQPIEDTTEFMLSTKETASEIHIKAVGEIIISGITDDDNKDYEPVNHLYTIDVTNGMHLYVTTTDVVYDKTLLVNIYLEPGESEFNWGKDCGSIITDAGRSIPLNPGLNKVAFNEVYDGTFKYSINPRPSELHTMLDGEEIEVAPATLDTYYVFTPKDGSMLRTLYIYATEEGTEKYFVPQVDDEGNEMFDDDGEPLGEWKERPTNLAVDVPFREHSVTYQVDEKIVNDMLFLREDFEPIDFSSGVVNEYTGTRIYVYVKEESNVALYAYKPRSSAPMKAPGSHGVTQEYPAPEGYKYVDTIIVNGPVIMKANQSDYTTGVEDVEVAAPVVINGIYNLQGICIKADATADDLHSLPAGVYIFNGKKILVK